MNYDKCADCDYKHPIPSGWLPLNLYLKFMKICDKAGMVKTLSTCIRANGKPANLCLDCYKIERSK